ncbi:MAG: hypothetical protein JW706_04555 [Opitutales bacterium]|nr:hypothetical protein [Opitutales bacterium]
MGFERRDAWKAEWERMNDTCTILQSFATLASDARPEVFFREALSKKSDHLLRIIPDLRFALFRDDQMVYAWPDSSLFDSIDPETLSWEPMTHSAGYPAFRANTSDTILQRFSIHDGGLETIGIVASPDPNRVFLDTGFWKRAIWRVALLALAGVWLAEFLARFLKTRLQTITETARVDAAGLPTTAESKSTRVQETEDLQNALETLRKTLGAKEVELNLPPDEKDLAVPSEALLNSLLGDIPLTSTLSSTTHRMELLHQPKEGGDCVAFIMNPNGSPLGIHAHVSGSLSLLDQATCIKVLFREFTENRTKSIPSIIQQLSEWKWIHAINGITIECNADTPIARYYAGGQTSVVDLSKRTTRVIDPTHLLPQALIDQVEKAEDEHDSEAWIQTIRDLSKANPGHPLFLIHPIRS